MKKRATTASIDLMILIETLGVELASTPTLPPLAIVLPRNFDTISEDDGSTSGNGDGSGTGAAGMAPAAAATATVTRTAAAAAAAARGAGLWTADGARGPIKTLAGNLAPPPTLPPPLTLWQSALDMPENIDTICEDNSDSGGNGGRDGGGTDGAVDGDGARGLMKTFSGKLSLSPPPTPSPLLILPPPALWSPVV